MQSNQHTTPSGQHSPQTVPELNGQQILFDKVVSLMPVQLEPKPIDDE